MVMLRILAVLFLMIAPVKWVYVVNKAACNGCGNCVYFCPQDAISMQGGDAWIDPEICDGCGICVNYCPRNAIYREWYTGIEESENGTDGLVLSQNPATAGSVTISGIRPDSGVKMIDWAGRIVMEGYGDDQGFFLLDFTDVPSGVYLIVSGADATVLTYLI